MFNKITFHPFRTNILDCVGRTDLVTQDGRLVQIKRKMRGEFVITIGDEIWETDDNLSASRILNDHEVGER